MVLGALSREIRSRCPEEILYVDDLTLVWLFEGLKGRLDFWKGALESKGLTVNVKKTKMIISSESSEKVTSKGKFPCSDCREVYFIHVF